MERDLLADRLKAYACFLVLFGHVLRGVRLSGVDIPEVLYIAENFIWSFHVQLFLFLNGYVYKITGGSFFKGTGKDFVLRKLLNLGVPYTAFSVMYIVINSFVSGANTRSELSDILSLFTEPTAQYWYLYALFFVFLAWTVLSHFTGNLQITLIFAAVGYILPLFGVGFGCLESAVYAAIPFGLGTLADFDGVKRCKPFARYAVVICHAVSGYALSALGLIGNAVIKEAMMLFGIAASVLFVSEVTKLLAVGRSLDFLGMYSFQVFLLHTVFTAAARVALLRLGITSWVLHVAVGTACGILFPVLCARIARKTLYLDFFFFPEKTLKRIKNMPSE